MIKSISWPSSVWKVVWSERRRVATHLEEELEKVDIVRLLTEVLLEEEVDGALEHKRVVDSNVADVGLELVGGANSNLPCGTSRAVHGG